MIKQLFMHLKVDLPRQDIQAEIDSRESTHIGQISPTQIGNLTKMAILGLFQAKQII